jgi:1-phosphofructokinase
MITTVTLNPAVDKTVEIDNFTAGSVNRVASVRLDAGGKGINVSKVSASLGGKTRALGILAGKSGSFIKEYLDSIGVENKFIFIDGETRTNLKIVDKVQQMNTDINEPGPCISEADERKVIDNIIENMSSESIAVFSGSVPVGINKGIYKELIRAAGEKGVKAILDADGELLRQGLEAGPYLIKPNINELEGLLERKINGLEDVVSVSRSIMDKYGVKIVVVSLGEKGAVFINDNCTILAKGIKVQVKSTVGAGDSMVAALAFSIDKGLSFEEAVKLSVAAGTANVMTSGTQPAEVQTIMDIKEKVTFEYM